MAVMHATDSFILGTKVYKSLQKSPFVETVDGDRIALIPARTFLPPFNMPTYTETTPAEVQAVSTDTVRP